MSAAGIVTMAESQVGYLEKASNAYLDDFTANAGSNNYTKFARDIWPTLQAQPWCDIFVSWCAEKAGEAQAVGRYAYCPSHVQFFKNRGQWYPRGKRTPQPGDVIFFGYTSEAAHVGLVRYTAGDYVFTVEGNASGYSGLTPNGGAVVKKSYLLGSSYILGYGVPSYSGADTPLPEPEPEVKTEDRYAPWRTWKNGSTEEIVYKDSDLTTRIGSLNPRETALCMCRYGESYLVTYKLDDTDDDWAAGWVGYDGGVS